MPNAILLALLLGLFGLVILGLLWPGPRHGTRLLARWGVGEPTADETAVAVRYLRRRRFWYPWLYLGLPMLARLADGRYVAPGTADDTLPTVVVTLLLGALLAEVLAQRPVRGPRREAVLGPRRLRDLVPAWALVLVALAAVLLGTVGTAALLGAAWSTAVLPRGFAVPALVAGAVCVAVLAAVLYLTVRRPPEGTARVDAALRVRSARVATGLAVAVLCALAGSAGQLGGLLVAAAGVVAWSAVAGPPPRWRAGAALRPAGG